MNLGILHLISCAFMTGLIWAIQCLHYPAFAAIERERFPEFHLGHTRKITFIVAPIMLLELITAVALLFRDSGDFLVQINFLLLVLTWACTAFLSVPLHRSLESGQDLQKISRLVSTNWFRTLLWSLRLALLAVGGIR